MSSDGAGTFAWVTAPTDYPPYTVDVNVVAARAFGRLVGRPARVGDGGIGWWQEPSLPAPVLALDDAGDTFLAWSRIDQLTETPLSPSAVWSSTLAADGTVTGASIDQPAGPLPPFASLLARGFGRRGGGLGMERRQPDAIACRAPRGVGLDAAPKILEEMSTGTRVGFVVV